MRTYIYTPVRIVVDVMLQHTLLDLCRVHCCVVGDSTCSQARQTQGRSINSSASRGVHDTVRTRGLVVLGWYGFGVGDRVGERVW